MVASLVLSTFATRIEATRRWSDLDLPRDVASELRRISALFSDGAPVPDVPPAASGSLPRRGVVALFTGPSGTGKTLAAEALATDLRLDVFRIDLAAVVSRHAGETEKHLDLVFAEVPKSGAILFFDEADALFGKRTPVADSHDRYSNAETNYLLQRVDSYAGITILATNRTRNIDDAFVRRVRFVVDFP